MGTQASQTRSTDLASGVILPTCLAGAMANRYWRLIMDMAAEIDADYWARLDWYASCPIEVLGGRTAAELVASDQGAQVVGFLYHTAWLQRQTARLTLREQVY